MPDCPTDYVQIVHPPLADAADLVQTKSKAAPSSTNPNQEWRRNSPTNNSTNDPFYTNVLHTYLRRRAETFETPGGQAQSLAGMLRPSANLATRSPTYCAAAAAEAATPHHSCSHNIHIPPRSPAFASRTAPFCPQLPSSMDLCFPVQQPRRSTCASLGSESLEGDDEYVCEIVWVGWAQVDPHTSSLSISESVCSLCRQPCTQGNWRIRLWVAPA